MVNGLTQVQDIKVEHSGPQDIWLVIESNELWLDMEILVTNTELQMQNYFSKLQFEDSWVSGEVLLCSFEVEDVYERLMLLKIYIIYLCFVRGDGGP